MLAAPSHCAWCSSTRGLGISWGKGSKGSPPCPNGGQRASRPRDPFLEATIVVWTLWGWSVRVPSSGMEPGLSKCTLHPISKGSGYSPPGLEVESGDQLCRCVIPGKVLAPFQLHFLTCAPASWLALRTRGRNLLRGPPWSSWASDKHQEA